MSSVPASLARVAATSFDDYSPALVAAAVNDLRPLGAAAALAAIRGAGTSVPPPPGATGLLWAARVLFDLPDGVAFPRVRLGTPVVAPPRELAEIPRFPVLLEQDVPFLLVRGYELAGLPESLDDHLAVYDDAGTVREAALDPAAPSADLERAVLARWAAAHAGATAPDVADLVAAQLARLRG